MPAWFFKYLPHGLVVLAVLGGLWFIYHKGEVNATNRFKLEQAKADVRQARADQAADRRVKDLEKVLQDTVGELDGQLGTRLRSLTQLETTVVQPTLTREIRSEKRFTDPAAGITDGMLGALNAARSSSNLACVAGANGSTTCSLPAARPAAKQGTGNAGLRRR